MFSRQYFLFTVSEKSIISVEITGDISSDWCWDFTWYTERVRAVINIDDGFICKTVVKNISKSLEKQFILMIYKTERDYKNVYLGL